MVGTSGSGKSTLARELAEILGVPHLELDAVHHQPGWAPLPTDEFRRIIAARAAADGWVIDGNYSRVRDLVWARADTVGLALNCDTTLAPALRQAAAAYRARTGVRVFVFATGPGLILVSSGDLYE